MKAKLAIACSALLLGLGPAMAADLPAPEVPLIAAAPAAAHDWTGFYVGAHVGYGWGAAKSETPGRDPWDMDGVIGGGQVGANLQWNSFVLGVEADISATGIESGSRAIFPGVRITSNIDYLGTVRGRLGVAFDQFLVYGTGGFAYAQREVNRSGGGTTTVDHTGWAAGGGVEWAFTGNWSVRVEYLHADFSAETYDIKRLYGSDQVAFDQDIVRVGVNYKF